MIVIKLQSIFLLFNFFLLNSWCLAKEDAVCKLIRMNSFECETHKIQTKDDYILTVHRIPSPSSLFSSNNLNSSTAIKRPLILMHGFTGSAADFILAGKNSALSALLHDENFDVWLPNARGTTHSKRHLKFDSSQSDFWNFSWHEIGTQDLSAIVDYILNLTNHTSLHYVGHSQGSTSLFVMLSEKPEYNNKIISGHLLAPVTFLKNLKSRPVRFLAIEIDKVEALLNHLGLHELFPSTALNQLGGHLLCGNGIPTQNLCMLLFSLLVGFSDFQMDRNLFPRIFETTPAGVSRKQFQHFAQLITSGKFQQYDYKSKSKNYRFYKSKSPPEYNLRNVRVPLQMFYGNRDLLLDKQDVLRLVEKLGNTHYSLKEVRGFNHIDLLYSKEAPRLIYKNILQEVNKFYK